MTKIFSLILIALVFCTSCAGFGTYMKDRGLDFVDCFKADVGYGYGLSADIKATSFINAGAGFSLMHKYGFKGRYSGYWGDIQAGFPFVNAYFFNIFSKTSDLEGGMVYGLASLGFSVSKRNESQSMQSVYKGHLHAS